MKTCTKCGERKPLERFHKSSGGTLGRCSHCADCRNASKRNRYTRAERKEAHLRQKFGMSLEDHDAMYNSQQGRCAICSKSIKQHDKGTHVDHCHDTGAVRGLLCHNCNRGLGYLEDSVEVLLQAALYLERSGKC